MFVTWLLHGSFICDIFHMCLAMGHPCMYDISHWLLVVDHAIGDSCVLILVIRVWPHLSDAVANSHTCICECVYTYESVWHDCQGMVSHKYTCEWVCMADSTENATPSKSTKSRNSNSSVQNPNLNLYREIPRDLSFSFLCDLTHATPEWCRRQLCGQ